MFFSWIAAMSSTTALEAAQRQPPQALQRARRQPPPLQRAALQRLLEADHSNIVRHVTLRLIYPVIGGIAILIMTTTAS